MVEINIKIHLFLRLAKNIFITVGIEAQKVRILKLNKVIIFHI